MTRILPDPIGAALASEADDDHDIDPVWTNDDPWPDCGVCWKRIALVAGIGWRHSRYT